MFLKILIPTLVVVALCFLGLGIQTFFSKKKKFPEYEVGHNKEMKKLGIICVHQQMQQLDNEFKKGKKVIDPDENPDCQGCALLHTVDCSAEKIK